MLNGFSREILNSLLPEGLIWTIEQDSDLDKLLDAMGENDDLISDDLKSLSSLRDPNTTMILSDLEKEYGVQTDLNLSEETRRMILNSIVHPKKNNGSKDNLQDALNEAGFDVQVHENSPAVDPDLFLNNIFLMVANGDNAYAGFIPLGGPPSTAIAGKTGGSLLVNGSLIEQQPNYLSVASGDNMFAGNSQAIAGRYNDLNQTPVLYPIPDDPNSWPFFFFVGGDATRDGSGKLININFKDIVNEQRSIFERIILKYKPLHSWAGLMIDYV